MARSIGQEFLDKTTYRFAEPSDQMKKIPPPPLELPYDQDLPYISLPDSKELSVPSIPVKDAIENRRSIRKYSTEAMNIDELAFLLWSSQGVQTVFKGQVTIRNVPSAGARHAFETFLLVNNVTGIKPGLYRYIALSNILIPHPHEDTIREDVTKACLKQKIVTHSAVTFIWVAVPYRMTYRYAERGYRYLFMDVGHVGQNLYLAGEALQLGVCTIAAFIDEDMNDLLRIDGVNAFTIYIATVGKKL